MCAGVAIRLSALPASWGQQLDVRSVPPGALLGFAVERSQGLRWLGGAATVGGEYAGPDSVFILVRESFPGLLFLMCAPACFANIVLVEFADIDAGLFGDELGHGCSG